MSQKNIQSSEMGSNGMEERPIIPFSQEKRTGVSVELRQERASELTVDLAVIGAGMAGLSAALFALNRGMTTALMGKSHSMNFATGLMDLMGVYPAGNEWASPWEAMKTLVKRLPGHPYAKVIPEDIVTAMTELKAFLDAEGLAYHLGNGRNTDVITSLGTIKKSYMIPQTMWKGAVAFEKKRPALIVDFFGMKIYSAKQIVSTLETHWPGLRAVQVEFPGMEHLEEVYPEHMARALDVEENRVALVQRIKPILDQKEHEDVEYIGFPALLGMGKSAEGLAQLEQFLGKSIFEIPTPPVSVPGIRLHETLSDGLQKNGALHSYPEMVQRVEPIPHGRFRLTAGGTESKRTIVSKGVILATGRFMGRGLIAERTGIREALLDLPVVQPVSRELWHHKDLFHPEGHPLNRAGIETDRLLRPLKAPGTLFAEHLYAVGAILAHSDWTRMKCGSGVAIATAFAAVRAFYENKP